MRFRFTGQYTNGHTSINMSGFIFEGREPSDITDAEAIRRLSGNPEFETIEAVEVVVSDDVAVPVEVPEKPKRGRPKKGFTA